jgi:hypothetical protein
MGKAQAALNALSSQIVNVSQDCFAQASNIIKLDLQGDEVTIDGLTINSDISTKIGTCSTKTGIATGPLQESVSRGLNKINAGNPINDSYSKANVNMKAVIADSVGVDVVNRCLAVALNTMIIRVTNARQISLANVTVNQTASSEIEQCISTVNIKIGNTNQSLMQFLERNEDKYTVEGYTEPVCPFEATKPFLYGGCGALVFAILVCVGVAFYVQYFLRKSKAVEIVATE